MAHAQLTPKRSVADRGAVSARSSMRFLAVALIAVLVTTGLSACFGQANAATLWLGAQSSVESVDTDRSLSGFTYTTHLRAVIKESATDEEIQQLIGDASAYALKNGPDGNFLISLSYRGLRLWLPANDTDSSVVVDRWNVLRVDPRIHGGSVSNSGTYVVVDRTDLAALALENSSVDDSLRVVAYSDDKRSSFTLKSCGVDETRAAFAQSVLDDDAVIEATIDFCSGATLATSSPEEMVALATRVRQLAAQAGEEQLAIEIESAADDTGFVDSSLPLAQFNDPMQRLLTRVSEQPSTLASLHLNADGVLRIGVTGDSALQATIALVLADPDLDAARKVAYDGLVHGTKVYLEARTLDEAERSLELAEKLIAVPGVASVAVSPSVLKANMMDDDLTKANGRAAIDIILASGQWNGQLVSIGNGLSGYEAFTVADGVPVAAESDLVKSLGTYWLASVPTS